MAWKQLLTPNLNINVQPGWCEKAVREAFGFTTGMYPTATDHWNAERFKHTDRNLPPVFVPVYWAVKGVPAGHVAIAGPDGRIYSTSSPTATKFTVHANLEACERYYGGLLQWRGWGECVNNQQVATLEADPAPAPTPAPQLSTSPAIGDKVTTTSETDQNGAHLNLAIINDGQSVWTETNSRGFAVLRKDGVVRCAVAVDSLRKV
jgi:hypothetical protein